MDKNGQDIEDDFTPRVCLGKSINDCIAGLISSPSITKYHLYQTTGNVDVVDLAPYVEMGPSYVNVAYGPRFVLSDWLDDQFADSEVYVLENRKHRWNKPSNLPQDLEEQFKFCVPDALETHELWSLKPVNALYMGVLDVKNKSIAPPEETSQNAVPRAAAAALRKLIATEDYRLTHKAPGKAGAPLHDLTVNDVYPKDVYQTLHQYKDHNPGDDYSLAAIRKYKGKPDASVMIYRAVPKGVTTINPGDFVTLAKEYAKNHAYKLEDDGSNGVVIKMTVKANQLYTDGNSINEWGYNP